MANDLMIHGVYNKMKAEMPDAVPDNTDAILRLRSRMDAFEALERENERERALSGVDSMRHKSVDDLDLDISELRTACSKLKKRMDDADQQRILDDLDSHLKRPAIKHSQLHTRLDR